MVEIENKVFCVTGGAGMIGSNLCNTLVSLGAHLHVIDNLWRGKLEYLYEDGEPIIDLNDNFHRIDLSVDNNIDQVRSIIKKCDYVIHLADIVAGIGFVFNQQYEVFNKNVNINNNLFRATIDSNIEKLIYVGTACSFPKEIQSGLDAELDDSDLFPANPESAYGWSKLIGQIELQYLVEVVDFEITTLILHNVYGPNCEYQGKRTQVIPSLINKVLEADEKDTIEVWGTGEQGRAFIYVDDVTEAIIRTIKSSNLPAFMQIGPDVCTSISELVNILIDISGKDLSIFYNTSKPEGDKGRYANYTKAKKYLNWQPNVNLINGLKRTYHWIRNEKYN